MTKINVKILVKSLLCIIFIGSMVACSKKTTEAMFEPDEVSKAAKAPRNVVAKPFPQAKTPKWRYGFNYPEVSVVGDMPSKVQAYYDKWKARYIKKVTGTKMYFLNQENPGSPYRMTSEALGYGMVISAYMAGYDPEAKAIFDGLFAVARKFKSKNNDYLMGWALVAESDGDKAVKNVRYELIVAGEGVDPKDVGKPDSDSATDGDMDMAYALLLADKQWGSSGTTNYKNEAINTIKALYTKCVDTNNWTLKMGDWQTNDADEEYDYRTRSSDFMPQHLKVFKAVDTANASGWQKVIDKIYSILEYQNANGAKGGSKGTGLIPDFFTNLNGNYVPVSGKSLESANDGDFSFNACRVPWRIMTDYVVTDDARSYQLLSDLTAFTDSKGSQNMIGGVRISSGSLGELIPTEPNDPEGLCFTAPLGASGMVWEKFKGTQGQSNAISIGQAKERANKAWKELTVWNDKDVYFGQTINMQVLILMSGNWWQPQN